LPRLLGKPLLASYNPGVKAKHLQMVAIVVVDTSSANGCYNREVSFYFVGLGAGVNEFNATNKKLLVPFVYRWK